VGTEPDISRRRLIVATSVVLIALSVAPALAEASPRWLINGQPAGAKHKANIGYGTITLENAVLGKISCQTITSGSIFDESEKGRGLTEGFETSDCTTEPTRCPGSFVSAERPVAVKEEPGTHKPQAVFVHGELPWTGELAEKEVPEKRRTLKISTPLLTVVMPCLNLEVPFEGVLEPLFVNGIGNGLTPSHLQFQGKGGTTGFLTTNKLGTEKEDDIAYLSGELATVGGDVELLTAD
jgi:hypothetical protein